MIDVVHSPVWVTNSPDGLLTRRSVDHITTDKLGNEAGQAAKCQDQTLAASRPFARQLQDLSTTLRVEPGSTGASTIFEYVNH